MNFEESGIIHKKTIRLLITSVTKICLDGGQVHVPDVFKAAVINKSLGELFRSYTVKLQ